MLKGKQLLNTVYEPHYELVRPNVSLKTYPALTNFGVSHISFPALIISSEIKRGGGTKTKGVNRRSSTTPCIKSTKTLMGDTKAVVRVEG